jgi:hypothetical protein
VEAGIILKRQSITFYISKMAKQFGILSPRRLRRHSSTLLASSFSRPPFSRVALPAKLISLLRQRSSLGNAPAVPANVDEDEFYHSHYIADVSHQLGYHEKDINYFCKLQLHIKNTERADDKK